MPLPCPALPCPALQEVHQWYLTEGLPLWARANEMEDETLLQQLHEEAAALAAEVGPSHTCLPPARLPACRPPAAPTPALLTAALSLYCSLVIVLLPCHCTAVL